MSDRVLAKYASLHSGGATEAEEGLVDDLGVFGWLRGVRDRAVMLELRKSPADILAVDYGGLEIEFDASVGITILTMTARKIVIKGRNLNAEIRPNVRLFEGITRHRVPWIMISDRAARLQDDRNDIVIESITW